MPRCTGSASPRWGLKVYDPGDWIIWLSAKYSLPLLAEPGSETCLVSDQQDLRSAAVATGSGSPQVLQTQKLVNGFALADAPPVSIHGDSTWRCRLTTHRHRCPGGDGMGILDAGLSRGSSAVHQFQNKYFPLTINARFINHCRYTYYSASISNLPQKLPSCSYHHV